MCCICCVHSFLACDGMRLGGGGGRLSCFSCPLFWNPLNPPPSHILGVGYKMLPFLLCVCCCHCCCSVCLMSPFCYSCPCMAPTSLPLVCGVLYFSLCFFLFRCLVRALLVFHMLFRLRVAASPCPCCCNCIFPFSVTMEVGAMFFCFLFVLCFLFVPAPLSPVP